MFITKPFVTDRRIRFALVGCGRISANHFDAIEKHAARAELVGVCDVDPAALRKAEERTGASGFRSLDALLAGTNADVVILATPSGLHRGPGGAGGRGRPACNDREADGDPLAGRQTDGARLRYGRSPPVRGQAEPPQRHPPTAQAGRGKGPVRADLYGDDQRLLERPQSYYDSAPWRGTWEFDGGAFMNQASHYVDLLDWLIGPVESVQAYTATLERNIQVEDTGVVSIRWRTGALGSMNVTMLTYPKNLEGSITIIGEKGTVRIGGVAVNRIDHWEFADPTRMTPVSSRPATRQPRYTALATRSYYDNVIQSLRGEAKPDTDGREGLHSLEILIATYLSARDGRRVALPLEY